MPAMFNSAPHLVLPADERYDQARSSFNLLVDQQPSAVAYPETVADVVAAVDYARRAGLRVAPQATGHNQAPLGDLEGTLLLNVSRMQDVSFDAGARSVRVGAGVKWQSVAPRLSAHGLAGLHGSSPDVGIAGYSLGGGIGWLSRKHGMQTNAVTAIELVTADGAFVRADREHEPDLFWALRGGGGNFGVVTAIEFSVVPCEEVYAGALFFEFERSSEVLHTWSAMLPALPEELMTWTSLLHFPPLPEVPAFARGKSYAVVMAAFEGDEAEGAELLRPLRELGPVRDTLAAVPPVVLGDLAMDPYDPLPIHSGHQLLDGLSPESIDAVMVAVGPDSGRGPALSMLQFRHMGGALSRPTPDAGARATLPGEVSLFALGVVPDPALDEPVRAAIGDVCTATAAQVVGDYPNFVEVPADASAFFDAATWARLRAIKAAVDPGDVFRGNHYIPPAR
jgi:FAD/FMN-containing dehydrogenase